MRLPSVLTAALVLALASPADAALFYARQLTTANGEIVAFDTDTNTVLRTYAVAIPDIDGLARDPLSDNLFVASSNGGGLFRLNLVTGAVSAVPVAGVSPFNPSALAFGPGQDLFIANQTAPAPASVVRFDVPTGLVENVFTAGGVLRTSAGLAVDPTTGNLFVSSLGLGVPAPVVQLNPNTGAVLQTYTSPLLGNVFAVAVGDGGVEFFTTNFSGGTVLAVNVANGSTRVFASGLTSPTGLAFGPDGNLYVTSGNAIAVLNGTSGARVGTIPVGTGGPEYLAFGDLPPGAVAAVPEPASLMAAGIGGLTLLVARRVRGRATAAAGR
ncbi:MAG: hypothetical protein C0501_20140 [Isosphaera sp.]|nr:hypothetical protein [Isosphaera sp.]